MTGASEMRKCLARGTTELHRIFAWSNYNDIFFFKNIKSHIVEDIMYDISLVRLKHLNVLISPIALPTQTL